VINGGFLLFSSFFFPSHESCYLMPSSLFFIPMILCMKHEGALDICTVTSVSFILLLAFSAVIDFFFLSNSLYAVHVLKTFTSVYASDQRNSMIVRIPCNV